MRAGLLVTTWLFTGLAAQAQVSSLNPPYPSYASSGMGTMYASSCPVVVNTPTPTSTFCPSVTDPTSVTKRTYPPNSLTLGKSFIIMGGGIYSVPTGNLNTADIKINVGAATVMALTTPAAPVGTGQGIQFNAQCTVRTTTTINCTGQFDFIVAGATGAPAPFNQTSTFDPTVANVIDVTGDWNTNAGALNGQTTTVTQAAILTLN